MSKKIGASKNNKNIKEDEEIRKNNLRSNDNNVEIIPIEKETSELENFLQKIVPWFKRFKNTPTIYPLYFFYFAFGITFLISLALYDRLGVLRLQFYISETEEMVEFDLSWGEIMGVFLLGVVFSLSALRAFELLRSQVDPHKKSYAKRLFLVIFYVGFSVLLITGIFAHMIGNQLHEYIYQIEDTTQIVAGTPLASLRAGIYLWDEILSHLFIGIGFFGMLYIDIYLDLINDHDLEIRSDETFAIIFGTSLLGAGIAIGFIEGQAAFVLIFPSIFLIIAIIIVMRKNRMRYHKNPFVLAGLVLCVSYLITLVIYASITGLKSFYPYFYQLTELGLF